MSCNNLILGAFVGDAASVGCHWIYDSSKLKEFLGDKFEDPYFIYPGGCPFYNEKDFPGHYGEGQGSPYSEECGCLLDFLKENNGEFVGGQEWTDYLVTWLKSYKGRKNHCSKDLEKNVEEGKKFPDAGADDSQANIFWKVIGLAEKYYKDDSYLEKVRDAVRAHQNSEMSIGFSRAFAVMVKSMLEGKPLKESILSGKEDGNAPDFVCNAIDRGIEASSFEGSLDEFFLEYGKELTDDEKWQAITAKSCSLPGAPVVGIKLLLETKKDCENPYTDIVKRNIQAGGDCCGRLPFLMLIFCMDKAEIPAEWMEKTKIIDQLV